MYSLRPYQEACVERVLSDSGRPIECAPTGCHPAGTRVLTIDGRSIPVERVKIGARLLGPDNKPRTVVGLIRGYGPLYRIDPLRGSESFIVNEDHILSLKTTSDGKWMKAGRITNISVRDYFTKSKTFKHVNKLYRSGAMEFDGSLCMSDLFIDPWLLGMILGDGSIKYGTVSVTTADERIVDEMQALIPRGMSVVRGTYPHRTPNYGLYININGRGKFNPIMASLRYYGLMGRGSGTKFIPHDYKYASIEVRLKLLAGLLDSDGSLGKNCYDYVSKSKRLAVDVQFLARSCGLTVSPINVKIVGGTDYYRLNISGETSIVPCVLKRKQATLRRQKKDPRVTGFSITPIGSGNFYGFTLEGDGLYLLDDFTVTHNSGKTVIQAFVAQRALENGERTAILTPRAEIFDQTHSALQDICGSRNIATLRAGHRWDQMKPIHVVSWPTLTARMGKSKAWLPDVDRVIVDEAHLCAAAKIMEVMEYYRHRAKVVGFTATPARQSGKGLGEYFTHINTVTTVRQLISEGFLAPCEYWGGRQADMKGVKIKQGDYDSVESSKRQVQLVGDVVDNWLRLASERHTIVFAVDIAHALALVDRFLEVGIVAAVLHSKMLPDDRDETVRRYKDGHIRVLINVMIASYGFDAPSTDCIVMARPTKSIVLHLQMIGRGMRPYPLKQACLILDHGGNVRRLGMAEDEYNWTLDKRSAAVSNKSAGEREKRVNELYECQSCSYQFTGRRDCPKCGTEKPMQRREVATVDADLVRIGKKTVQQLPKDFPSHEHFYRMLLGHAKERGYKAGWAAHKFKDKAGDYPPFEWNNLAPLPMSERVHNWILSQAIRYAKRNARAKTGTGSTWAGR